MYGSVLRTSQKMKEKNALLAFVVAVVFLYVLPWSGHEITPRDANHYQKWGCGKRQSPPSNFLSSQATASHRKWQLLFFPPVLFWSLKKHGINNLPFRIVESQSFQALMEDCRPGFKVCYHLESRPNLIFS